MWLSAWKGAFMIVWTSVPGLSMKSAENLPVVLPSPFATTPGTMSVTEAAILRHALRGKLAEAEEIADGSSGA